MGIKQIRMIKNGNYVEPFVIYECDKCGAEIYESDPFWRSDDETLCCDCAFISGRMTEKEYLSAIPIKLDGMRAEVHDGKIYIESNNHKFPWEKTPKQSRQGAKYEAWRTSVFERDNYTCQICGQVGGKLNAHHMVPFARDEGLRYEVDNGVTLCERCHKRIHKEKDEKWIK